MKLNEIKPVPMKIIEAKTRSEKLSLLGLEYVEERASYQRVDKTQMSVRFDKGNTNKKTQDHAHVFARPEGKGKQLFAINVDGTGHDGSSGEPIPKRVGDFLKKKGYEIPLNFVVESISVPLALEDRFIVFIVCN
jgi:hypothetical protein